MYTNERTLEPLHSHKNLHPFECSIDSNDKMLLMFGCLFKGDTQKRNQKHGMDFL